MSERTCVTHECDNGHRNRVVLARDMTDRAEPTTFEVPCDFCDATVSLQIRGAVTRTDAEVALIERMATLQQEIDSLKEAKRTHPHFYEGLGDVRLQYKKDEMAHLKEHSNEVIDERLEEMRRAYRAQREPLCQWRDSDDR